MFFLSCYFLSALLISCLNLCDFCCLEGSSCGHYLPLSWSVIISAADCIFIIKLYFYSELSLPPQQDRSFCGGTSRRSAACTSWRLFTFRLNFLDTLAVVWNLTVITDSLWICWKFFFRLWQLCFWRKSSLDPAMTFTLSKPDEKYSRNKWKMTYYDLVFNQKYKWSVFMVFSHWAASPDDQ